MVQGPLVSVVIPCYNSALYLSETIESVLSQDYANIELILVDDGSEDDTANVVGRFSDSRLRYFYQDPSGRPSTPRNLGISKSVGRHIFLFDSDDIMLPGKIRPSVALLEKLPDIGLLFTNFAVLDEEKGLLPGTFLENYHGFHKLARRQIEHNAYFIRSADAYAGLIHENFIGTSGVAIPREVFSRLGGFDQTLTSGEDVDLWFRIAKLYDLVYLDIVGHRYRIRSMSVERGSLLRNAPNRIAVLNRQRVPGLPRHLAAQLRRRIAKNYLAMGYTHQCSGTLALARRTYLRGLKEHVSWPLLRGAMVTLLGNRVLQALKRFQRKNA
jgi:glycosyltransferase involved in cell wall biosynthesis